MEYISAIGTSSLWPPGPLCGAPGYSDRACLHLDFKSLLGRILSESCCGQLREPFNQGAKVPKYGVSRASVL